MSVSGVMQIKLGMYIKLAGNQAEDYVRKARSYFGKVGVVTSKSNEISASEITIPGLPPLFINDCELVVVEQAISCPNCATIIEIHRTTRAELAKKAGVSLNQMVRAEKYGYLSKKIFREEDAGALKEAVLRCDSEKPKRGKVEVEYVHNEQRFKELVKYIKQDRDVVNEQRVKYLLETDKHYGVRVLILKFGLYAGEPLSDKEIVRYLCIKGLGNMAQEGCSHLSLRGAFRKPV